jgi:hypothetical protein
MTAAEDTGLVRHQSILGDTRYENDRVTIHLSLTCRDESFRLICGFHLFSTKNLILNKTACSSIVSYISSPEMKVLMKIQVLKLHNNAARYKGSNTGKRARRKNLRHPRERFLVCNEALLSYTHLE